MKVWDTRALRGADDTIATLCSHSDAIIRLEWHPHSRVSGDVSCTQQYAGMEEEHGVGRVAARSHSYANIFGLLVIYGQSSTLLYLFLH